MFKRKQVIREQKNTTNYTPNIVENLNSYLSSGDYILRRIQNSASFAVLKVETRHLTTQNEQFSNVFSDNLPIDEGESRKAKILKTCSD